MVLSRVAGQPGDEVTLRVPYSTNSEMLARGKIVRMEKTPDGFIHGIQFSDIKTEFITLCIGLSDFLPDAEKPRQRKHPRVAWRTPIRYGLSNEKSGMLEALSQGGVTITVTTPFADDERIPIEIPHPLTKAPLRLTGKVIHQNLSRQVIGTYRVGLEFVETTPEMTSTLEEILRTILKQGS